MFDAVTTNFAPLDLSVDDCLPADIELVMGYRGGVTRDVYETALKRGLRAFPHLTGKLEGLRIVPPEGEFGLETVDSSRVMSIRDLEKMPLCHQSTTFIPKGRADSVFSARLTRFTGVDLSVLGMRVSHAAVDGTGLALFIAHCTAALRGVQTPAVFHERRFGFGTNEGVSDEAPLGYRTAGNPTAKEDLAGCALTLFAITAETVRSYFDAASLRDARSKLGGWLCAGIGGHFPEMALWCDPRGLNGIPPTYTGNLGCFLHFPLRGTTADELTMQLKATATRTGFQRIADTHRRIKLAESRGRPLVWDGAKMGVLQLNLVPHAVAGTDFGGGLPEYAILLSRNSSGLRISVTPDASRFLVEACLPDDLGEMLFEKCHAAGMKPLPWCQGENRC